MQKRILVADDDYFFRSVLTQSIQDLGYAVESVEDGSLAQTQLSLGKFDLLISDIKMVKVSGIDLLVWTQQNHPAVPVVLMTGFYDLLEAQQAAQLGAKGFLQKPFNQESLSRAIRTALTPDEPELKDIDDQFCRISIDDFISGSSIHYDIYIRITAQKYVKIAHTGADIDANRISHYRERGVEYLYLQREDFRKYLGMNAALTKLAAKSTIAKPRKLELCRCTSETLTSHFFNNEIDRASLEHAKNIIETSLSIATDYDDLFLILESLKNSSDYVYAHSVGVSFYAAMIGKALGWHSPLNLFKLSLGGLLHDIGKKELPTELLEKPRALMSHDEVRLYESHPARGMELLRNNPHLPTDVIHVVHQHHEDALGTGYPLHLSLRRTHPMARVTMVANELCNLTFPAPGGTPLLPREAFNRLATFKSALLDPAALAALSKALKIPLAA